MRYLLLVVALIVSGCADVIEEPPATEPPAEAGLFQHVATASDVATEGIWLRGDILYASGTGSGLRTYDISKPSAPRLLANETPDVGGSRDVDLMEHPSGRLLAILASGGVDAVDVTDPSAPFLVSTAKVFSHNVAVVPGTTVVYNSRSTSIHIPETGKTGEIDIIDFAIPEAPVTTVFAFPAVVLDPTGAPRVVHATTCHDITFNADLERAYCAGLTDTSIWDISDPLQPVIVQVIDWPGNNLHHAVWDAHGGDLLIIGDEFAGVLAPSPPCSSTVRDPTSALWFFDVSNLATPVPVGYFQIEHEQVDGERWPYCSTHFGTLVDDRDLLVMGWYSAGTVLIDFSDPAAASQVAHHYRPGTNTWEARYHDGYVYTGDTALGIDVLALGDP